MSVFATTWVWQNVHLDGDPVAKLVLLGLADHAADDGTAAWPSQAKLATYADVSVRTIHTKLKRLSELGLIRPGDQALTNHIQANRRPFVWDLAMDAWVEAVASAQKTVSAQKTHVISGQKAVSDKPSLEPSITELSLRSSSAQDLVGEWIDHCNGERPPGRVVGQISKEIGAMLREGIPYVDVRAGLQQWQLRGLHPSALASVVHEMRTVHSGGLRSRRQLETDSQFERMFARAKQLDQEHTDPKEIEQ